jgi:hypothetical protein
MGSVADQRKVETFLTFLTPAEYLTRGLPVISVDAKMKELIGPFKNPSHCWRRSSREVLDQDFHCKARLDTTPYATGQKVSKEERRGVRLKRRPSAKRPTLSRMFL